MVKTSLEMETVIVSVKLVKEDQKDSSFNQRILLQEVLQESKKTRNTL